MCYKNIRECCAETVKVRYSAGKSLLVFPMCNVIERTKARSLRPPEYRSQHKRQAERGEKPRDTNITKSSTACLSLDCFFLFVCFNWGIVALGFPGGSVVKNPPANAGDARDLGLLPGLGRSPGKGNGNSLQYSYLRNPMDRWAWWTTVHGIAKELDTTEYTHTHTHTHTHGCFTNLYVFLQWNESVIRNSSFLDLSPTHQPYPSRSPQSTELSSLYSRFPLAVSNMAVHIRPSQFPNSSPPCPPVTWNTSKHLIFWSHCHWCHSY